MKLFFILVFIMLTHFSFAQIKSEKIFNDVEVLNNNLIHDVYKYDESTNTLHYQMYFSDKSSFKAFTHFKSVETIFQDTFNKLNSTGILEIITALGIVDVKLLIKSESTGNVLVSKLLNLGVAKAGTLETLKGGS